MAIKMALKAVMSCVSLAEKWRRQFSRKIRIQRNTVGLSRVVKEHGPKLVVSPNAHLFFALGDKQTNRRRQSQTQK